MADGDRDNLSAATGANNKAPSPRGAAASSRDAAWVQWVAWLPVLILGLSVPGSLVADSSRTVIGDAVAAWMLLGAFSLVLFVPIIVVSLFGAVELRRAGARTGKWLASVGAIAATLAYALLIFSAVEAVVVPESRDPNSWGPVLTPGALNLVVVPYATAAAANAYVLVRLWRRRKMPAGIAPGCTETATL